LFLNPFFPHRGFVRAGKKEITRQNRRAHIVRKKRAALQASIANACARFSVNRAALPRHLQHKIVARRCYSAHPQLCQRPIKATIDGAAMMQRKGYAHEKRSQLICNFE
jgi:hypothetical protein